MRFHQNNACLFKLCHQMIYANVPFKTGFCMILQSFIATTFFFGGHVPAKMMLWLEIKLTLFLLD